MTRKASVGSISHGTLCTPDLLRAFADELEYLQGTGGVPPIVAEAHGFADALDEGQDEEDAALECLADLTDNYLQELAPPFCYFGAHEGDAYDFGFWPCWDAIEELPRVDDPSEVELHLGEAVRFVNDHGNVTVYGADGVPVLELV